MKLYRYYLFWPIFAFCLYSNLVYAYQYGETATCDFYAQTDLVKMVLDPNAQKLDSKKGFSSTSIDWENEKGKITIFFGDEKTQQVQHVSYQSICPEGARIESLTGIFNGFRYNIKFHKNPIKEITYYSTWEAEFTDINNSHRKFNGEMECRIAYRVYDSSSLESKTCKKEEDSNPNANCSCAVS